MVEINVSSSVSKVDAQIAKLIFSSYYGSKFHRT